MDQVQKASLQTLVHYVISCRSQGHFLPYRDYQILEQWVQSCPNPEALLMILDELLPKFYHPFLQKNQPLPSLASIKRKVDLALLHHKKRQHSQTALQIDNEH